MSGIKLLNPMFYRFFMTLSTDSVDISVETRSILLVYGHKIGMFIF